MHRRFTLALVVILTVGLATAAPAVHAASGRPIGAAVRGPFTTESATRELGRIRRSLDSGLAYRQAGIARAERGLSFRQGRLTTVFEGDTVVKEGIQHDDQTRTDPNAPLHSTPAYDITDPGSVGWYAFGSYRSPQFVTRKAFIPQIPTRRTPPARSAARLGFAMILPKGAPPPGGWPVAIYGPGLGRSYVDLYVTADHLAAAGIATISIDPLGHGFGPRSTITVTHVPDGFLNSGGGPILDIFREAYYRFLLAKWLRINRPNLLNGGPGLNGFTESEPDPTDPPMTHPAAGSFAIRRWLAYGNWLDRE